MLKPRLEMKFQAESPPPQITTAQANKIIHGQRMTSGAAEKLEGKLASAHF